VVDVRDYAHHPSVYRNKKHFDTVHLSLQQAKKYEWRKLWPVKAKKIAS